MTGDGEGPVLDRWTHRVERCACGGYITTTGNRGTDIYWAVRNHQRTLGHLAWRSSGGPEQLGVKQ